VGHSLLQPGRGRSAHGVAPGRSANEPADTGATDAVAGRLTRRAVAPTIATRRLSLNRLSDNPMADALLGLERPETLTSAVARSIGEAIVRGAFAPGQALPEVPLAAQLGTSRGTVREALRLLADQGLVEVIRHRGAFVAELTPRKAREIFTLRAELEAFAVRLVFERGGYPDATLDDLETTLERLAAAADGEADVFEVAELDMRFHDLLSRECDHQALLELLAGLRNQMRRFIVYTKLVNSDLEPESVTHRRLLDAVRSGDADRAAAEARRHVLVAGDQLLRKLAEEPSDAVATTAR
jgi:DNA-binding GntR family transcriptional regulator